ncbi:MAG: ankyrin repeat domain-containing protein [Wolbachia sp.]
MSYSKEDIRELCLDIDKIFINGDKYDDKYDDKVTSLNDLQNRLKRKAKFKEIDFQSRCEGDNSLGDLLLKYADEDDNSRVKDFLITNGFKLSQQEQIAAAANDEEEEQKTPDIAENEAGSNDFVNHGMTAEILYEQLIQGKETNRAIFDSFANAVRESNIAGDRGVFLGVIKLFTDLDSVIHLTDTASRTILDIAAITKQADVVKILLDSGKFDEEEKLNALNSAIIQGNVREVEPFLGHVNGENMQRALEVAMQGGQEEITKLFLDFIAPETPNVERNVTGPNSSNGNASNKPMATVPPTSNKETNANPTTTSSDNNKTNGFTNAQFSLPNTPETKESRKNFYTSLTTDVVGVVITGLFIAAAVMVPSVAGAVVCGIVAALVTIATGLHVKNSTLPSYRAMEENRVECIDQGLQI